MTGLAGSVVDKQVTLWVMKCGGGDSNSIPHTNTGSLNRKPAIIHRIINENGDRYSLHSTFSCFRFFVCNARNVFPTLAT